MPHRFAGAALTAILLASTALPAAAEPVFTRIATFAVADNLPEGRDRSTPTSSEIVAASGDGRTLIYTDSPLGAVGFIDIADPRMPKAGGTLALDGEPTSVAVLGATAFVTVNTSKDFIETSGRLVTVDLAMKTAGAACELGGQPDSVAIAPDGSFLAVAIENERNEEVNDGAIPQMPAGDLVILPVRDGGADCAGLVRVALSGLAEIAPEDPEPEFVSINNAGEIAVTLQENNHIVIVDGRTGTVKTHFSAGAVDLHGIDVKRDGRLDFTGSSAGVKREPDAVKWLDDERLMVANEGDYEGGARGFTIFSKAGAVLHEENAAFEREIARIGHYPDKRNKKGVEPEGLEVATFDGQTYVFVLAERASIVGVYRDTGGAPELVQLLPSGIGPEGAVAIPSRNLLVTANETDLGEDGGARSHVMIYERAEGAAAYPQLVSADKDGNPIGWGALSGLAADPEVPGRLHAVSDSAYAMSPSIFVIDATRTPAVILDRIPVTRGGEPAQKLDLEGIAPDGEGGFWLVSEGDGAKLVPHAILRVDGKGEIRQEIGLPAELVAHSTRYGLEGIAVAGEGEATTLWMAQQREWKDDDEGFVKLIAYRPASKEWGAVRYPLDQAAAGWVGLSEISISGDYAYIVERDNQVGAAAAIKKLYRLALSELVAAPLGGDLPVVRKEFVHDLLADMKAATNGYVLDKIEGFTIDKAGTAYAVTDNDGVDDASGETLFWTVEIGASN